MKSDKVRINCAAEPSDSLAHETNLANLNVSESKRRRLEFLKLNQNLLSSDSEEEVVVDREERIDNGAQGNKASTILKKRILEEEIITQRKASIGFSEADTTKFITPFVNRDNMKYSSDSEDKNDIESDQDLNEETLVPLKKASIHHQLTPHPTKSKSKVEYSEDEESQEEETDKDIKSKTKVSPRVKKEYLEFSEKEDECQLKTSQSEHKNRKDYLNLDFSDIKGEKNFSQTLDYSKKRLKMEDIILTQQTMGESHQNYELEQCKSQQKPKRFTGRYSNLLNTPGVELKNGNSTENEKTDNMQNGISPDQSKVVYTHTSTLTEVSTTQSNNLKLKSILKNKDMSKEVHLPYK